jgi:hypothetical protein
MLLLLYFFLEYVLFFLYTVLYYYYNKFGPFKLQHSHCFFENCNALVPPSAAKARTFSLSDRKVTMATVVIIGECTQGLVFMLERYLVEFQQLLISWSSD